MSSKKSNASFKQQKETKKEKSYTGFDSKTSNKINRNKVPNSPKSVFSFRTSSSFLSLDESDFESLSLCNQFSSNLSLSRRTSSFSGFDEIEDVLIPPIDLDEEDTKLIEEKYQDFDIFDENFLSPSFNAKTNFRNSPNFEECNPNSSKDFELDSDEPIFWPFDYESYKRRDLENFLRMSPPKNLFQDVVPVKKGLNPIRVTLQQKNNQFTKRSAQNPKPNLISTNGTRKSPIMPSRLGRSSNSSNEGKNKTPVKAKSEVAKQTKSHGKGNKEGGLKNTLQKEILIENSIGLHEFDGHEGIGEHEIILSGSPWKIASKKQSVDTKVRAKSKSNKSLKKFSEAKFRF